MVWKPATDRHAIERVSLTFQFAEWMPSVAWTKCVAGADKAFPRESHLRGLMQTPVFQVGGPVFLPSTPPRTEDAYGFLYHKVDSAQSAEDVSLRRDALSYSDTIYNRWAGFFARSKESLADYLNLYTGIMPVSSIQLEYWDRFNFVDGDSTSYSDVLDVNSGYIAPAVFKQSGMWHNHIGFFAPDPHEKWLVNLNIDVLDSPNAGGGEQSSRTIGLYSMVRDTAPEYEDADDLFSIVDELHVLVKSEFSKLLTPSVQQQLGLVASGE